MTVEVAFGAFAFRASKNPRQRQAVRPQRQTGCDKFGLRRRLADTTLSLARQWEVRVLAQQAGMDTARRPTGLFTPSEIRVGIDTPLKFVERVVYPACHFVRFGRMDVAHEAK